MPDYHVMKKYEGESKERTIITFDNWHEAAKFANKYKLNIIKLDSNGKLTYIRYKDVNFLL